MNREKHNPNLTGRRGKHIVVPPTAFEDAVMKALNTPASHAKNVGPKKKQNAKKR